MAEPLAGTPLLAPISFGWKEVLSAAALSQRPPIKLFQITTLVPYLDFGPFLASLALL